MEKTTLSKRGIAALFNELGPVDAIKFFQSMGVGKGDSVKEIEGITEKMTREEILRMLKKIREK